ncbi:MAG: hypothetical protein WA125_10360 [Desulfosporosinus sp.]
MHYRLFTWDIHTFKHPSIAINRYIIWRRITLEAYFHSDPRIKEWADQFTEKIFTVCLLTGVDSEVEFQKGCQIVTKITQLLQGISIFPSEYLEDGLKQLLEQQLPDSRVINNFPTFQDTMNRMLREGMMSAIKTQNEENMKPPAISNKNTPENTREEPNANTKRSANLLNDEFVAEEVEVIKPYGIIRKSQVPEQADRLKHVLSNIFPNVSVNWNLNLMGQTFLAQVEDILICLSNPEQPCPVENYNREGWKVYVCSSYDLMFPRRLERGIRQIQRLGKQSKK